MLFFLIFVTGESVCFSSNTFSLDARLPHSSRLFAPAQEAILLLVLEGQKRVAPGSVAPAKSDFLYFPGPHYIFPHIAVHFAGPPLAPASWMIISSLISVLHSQLIVKLAR